MKHRLLLVAAAALTLGVGLGTNSAHAEPDVPRPAVAASSDYWACVAVDGVAGACFGNVFEDLPYPYDYTP